MSRLQEKHTVEDGVGGLAHATTGVGVRTVRVVTEQGKVVGEGKALTDAVATQRAWNEANKVKP